MADSVLLRAFLTTERFEVPVPAGGEVVIRRSEAPREILLPDPSVSRRGRVAKLRLVDGDVVLEPSASANPVLLNGVKLAEPHALRAGDRIRIGYSVLVIQAINAPQGSDGEIRTVSLKTGYVKERDELGAESDRLAQWSEGFDQMRAAGDEREAAEVILQQMVRLAPADRALLALAEGSATARGCRELAACGLTSGEVERLLRWFGEFPPEPGLQAPTLGEVTGADSSRRAAVGRLDIDDVQWLFFLEPAAAPGGIHAAQRAMSVLSHLLLLYRSLHEQRTQKQLVDELSKTVRAYAGPADDLNFRIVESKFVYRSAALRGACRALARAAAAMSPVLLMGEAGTGKQVAADALHAASQRRHREMISVNLAEYPENLIESALFGHVRGAFTGASDRKGLVAHADGSTLFLDEIGEVPLSVQAKLLRVLERSEFRRLGELSLTKVDIRIVAATNRDLPAEVRRGAFRQDLYDRVNVIPITIPPLRERMEDVPLLAESFLRHFNEQMGKEVRIGAEGIRHLGRYTWPDNVRGLRNYIERTVALADFGPCVLGPDDLPPFAPVPATQTANHGLVDAVIESLREEGRGNQARVLSVLHGVSQRMSKSAWADRAGVSRPVFRAELRKLVAFSLESGVPAEFFESRVSLRPEDWEEINALRGAG